jgi:serine/threonine-protein phosphatase 5
MSDAREEAVALKNKGNDAFRNQNWPAALEFYTKAIDTYDKDPSFYTNRAQVRSFAITAHDHLLI